MQPTPSKQRSRFQKRLELTLESWLWRFRLISIVPVVMSLASTLLTFVIGTRDIAKSINILFHPNEGHHGEQAALAGVVSGIDFYLIGVALLIFGYGIYELLISEIDVYRDQSQNSESGGLLDIRNLDQLKEKLVKVLVVALIVSAFKAMISIPVKDVTTLFYFCGCVLLLALSGFLIALKPGKSSH
jgi:uncharacterized membrane protein YqhA